MVQLQFLFYYHNQLKNSEIFEDENSIDIKFGTCCYQIPSDDSASPGLEESEFYPDGISGSSQPTCAYHHLTFLILYKLKNIQIIKYSINK